MGFKSNTNSFYIIFCFANIRLLFVDSVDFSKYEITFFEKKAWKSVFLEKFHFTWICGNRNLVSFVLFDTPPHCLLSFVICLEIVYLDDEYVDDRIKGLFQMSFIYVTLACVNRKENDFESHENVIEWPMFQF